MKSTLAGLSALIAFAGILTPAPAADNEIFQPACFWRSTPAQSSPVSTAYYAPVVTAYAPPVITTAGCSTCQQPACNACQPCTTRYVQQSYYQAVTSYQQQTQYEPVTTYQTSSYYEPVTTYHTSYYFDPSCCSYKQVSTPETAYQLKTKSCPVQGYVAKYVNVPVTSYQLKSFWQPQTTCCQTTIGGAIPAVPANPPTVTPTMAPSPQLPSVIDEQRPNPSRYTPTPEPPQGKQLSSSAWRPGELPPPAFPEVKPIPTATPPAAAPAPVAVRIASIVVGGDASVEGTLLRSDQTPRGDAKMLFVNANDGNLRETTKTTTSGRFQLTLASGGWMVYLYNQDGTPVFHSRIEVKDESNAVPIVLVNR